MSYNVVQHGGSDTVFR